MLKKDRKLIKSSVAKSSSSSFRLRRLHIPRPDILHSYLSHREINQYLEYLERRYYKIIKIHKLGLSYEGRDINAIEVNSLSHLKGQALPPLAPAIQKLRTKSAPPLLTVAKNAVDPINYDYKRNVVFIEGGTHGREWMSISVALHCIYQITEKYLRNSDLLCKLRFLIVPIVNPDGYEYSRTKNKYWRKNRRPLTSSDSIGTDCNRNYDFHWYEGKAIKPQRSTYKGEKPFSEPETQALRSILQKLSPNILFFLSLHSCAQSIMYPWGYCKDKPENWKTMKRIARVGRDAIKSYNGRQYRVGSIAKMVNHPINGSVVDYAHGVLKIPLTLVMELPDVEYGFQPPWEKIDPIGHETWFGIRAMCQCAIDKAQILCKNDAEDKTKTERPMEMEKPKDLLSLPDWALFGNSFDNNDFKKQCRLK